MARIRTIKPEFWTDERLTECSLSARLLFIGMLNFADDSGNQPYSAKRLKMQVFPADNVDTQPLIDDLIAHGLLMEYSVSGEKYLNIKGFAKHQVINRPTKSAIPAPDSTEDSLRTHGVLTDGKEGNGREEERAKGAKAPLSADAATPCPHQEIIELYHANLPANPRIKVWDGTRSEALRTRWREDTKRQSLDYWTRFFRHCAASKFLTGQVEGHNGRPFTPGLDWLVKASNFAKIIEGRYHDKVAQ